MSKKYIVENEAGENEMSEGFQKNLNSYFNQNSYMSEISRREEAGVIHIVVRDVRES